LERHSGDILGFLDVELKMSEGEDSVIESSQLKDESSIISKDLLYHAAKELEDWKMNQKKKFNENLLQIEAQHLNMLGQEWKEREVEREKIVQEKLTMMQGLENELRKELEKIESERKEIEEKTKALKIDRENVETEKRNLKNQKLAIIDRLKQQLREKDGLLTIKDSEIEILNKKVKLLESEARRPPPRSARTSSSSADKSKRDEEMKTELLALREEKLTWSTSLDQSQKEVDWLKKNCEELRREITSLNQQKEKLFSEQIAGLERQVRMLSSDKSVSSLPDKTNLPIFDKLDKLDAEVQTSQVMLGNDDEEMETMTMDGLLRLEEHRAMLLRTGVYTQEDQIVVKLQEQIRKMRRRIEAEKDN